MFKITRYDKEGELVKVYFDATLLGPIEAGSSLRFDYPRDDMNHRYVVTSIIIGINYEPDMYIINTLNSTYILERI